MICDTRTVISERSAGSMGDPRRSSAPYRRANAAKTFGDLPQSRAGSNTVPYRRRWFQKKIFTYQGKCCSTEVSINGTVGSSGEDAFERSPWRSAPVNTATQGQDAAWVGAPPVGHLRERVVRDVVPNKQPAENGQLRSLVKGRARTHRLITKDVRALAIRPGD